MIELPPVQESSGLNAFPVLYWNHVGLEMNRVTHSLSGPQTGPTMSSRALGLLHLAMHDAYFAVRGSSEISDPPTYLKDADRPAPDGVADDLDNANAALSGAALRVLDRLYVGTATGVSRTTRTTLEDCLSALIAGYELQINTLSPAHRYGEQIADEILARLAVKSDEPGAQQGRYEPKQGPFLFRDEPVNPVRLVDIDPDHPERGQRAQRIYHAPFYGETVAAFAVTHPEGHTLAPPPVQDGAVLPDYLSAAKEVIKLGGAPGLPTTDRSPDQTVAGLFWAYDGANLIGTPPRLYNQILREIAWGRKRGDEEADTADFVRLFALANVAMADAGKFAWKEKYRFEFWRPLSGIREHHTILEPEEGLAAVPELADPFWLTLGAPETNTDRVTFKPPFPAYPSGHATFGAACFQMARHFYKNRDTLDFDDLTPDAIDVSFVSEELNGVSRDLRQPYDPTKPIEAQPGTVRTLVRRHFPSLWSAIHENALSRIYLGVHWIFDAAASGDVHDDNGGLKGADDVRYSKVWTAADPTDPADPDSLPTGGVPLGLGIANDIWANEMRAPDDAGEGSNADVQRSNTNTRLSSS